MKHAPFSRAKACEFRAWELDKTTRVQLQTMEQRKGREVENGEQVKGNREQGTGSGEQGTENRK